MGHWENYKARRTRRRELLAEEQDRALAREARRMRETFAAAEGSGQAVEVRWCLTEDDPRVARLLELNGMPRWVAFEEQFVVAEQRGEVTAAVRYRAGRERLLLGLLVADLWRDGGALARTLYWRARALAWEAGTPTVVVRRPASPRRAREAGFRRRGRYLQADATSEATAVPGPPPKPLGHSLRRAFSLWGRLSVPFFGTSPDGDAGR